MRSQELLEKYRQGERDFSHLDLSGANLSGFNLRGADFTGANLTEANLSWSFLNETTFVDANLRRADLQSASLSSSNLNNAVLSGANLTKSDLRLAQLQAADLNWAILPEAELSGANLTGAKLDQVNLERAKLSSAQLVGAKLMEANLRRANLAGANLNQANLREAHLEEANLREATLIEANLNEANLVGAYLRQANLSQADLHRVILSSADLSEAVLTGADLSRANLAGAYLLKVSFRKAHLLRANLQDVFLLRADLSEANLRGAELQRADLSGAYLSHTILSEADLTDAYLLESHLIHTILDGAQMTGCCTYNWHIEQLDFSKVECRYIYTQFNHAEKKPTERVPSGREFEPGELANQYENDRAIVNLYFTEPIHWEPFVFTLAQVEAEEPGLSLTIQSFEPAEDNYLVRLAPNKAVNSKQLIRRFLQLYAVMRQRFQEKRANILQLLEIESAQLISSPSLASLYKTPSVVPVPISDRRSQLYQEVVRQIQHILVTQAPDLIIDSVQRLLDYLNREGVSTIEIQKKLIGQAIFMRARRDRGFKNHLLQWQTTAPETVQQSAVGQAIKSAIVSLKGKS